MQINILNWQPQFKMQNKIVQIKATRKEKQLWGKKKKKNRSRTENCVTHKKFYY